MIAWWIDILITVPCLIATYFIGLARGRKDAFRRGRPTR